LRILDEEENGDIPEAIRTAVSLLSSTKQVEREDGIRALAKMNHPEAINALAQALRSPYPDVQRAAAIRLGVLRDPRAMPVLEKTIKENASWRQVYPSMMELLKAFGSDAVPSLGRVLLEDPIGLDRRDAATALGIIGDTKAVPQLVRSLHDDDSGVRGCAADALGEIRTSDLDAVRGLKELLSDSAEISHNRQRAILLPYVSDTACLALISIGTPEALQAVQAYREAHAQRFAVLPRQRKQKKTENEE
jgi:HEAT repeat protein